jgi:putative N6-adenine-specific DNA methylase
MSLFQISAPITITCHKRVAPYLAKEVTALGFTLIDTFVTGVHIQGTLQDCITLNLNLRCASQVLFTIDHFVATNADDIYDNVIDVAWEDLIPEDTYISVSSNVLNDTINNNLYANLRVKDAIVDRLRSIRGKRPETGSALNGAVVHLFWKGEEATLFLDTSGESLGRHGYRKFPGRAPMLESLAAATIIASGWDTTTPFINPMCGSGTLAIEAALMAKKATPALFRDDYAFMYLQDYDPTYYHTAYSLLKSRVKEQGHPPIIASDYSNMAIANAQKNAQAAGVADMITFEVCDFAETTVPENGKGAVFFNPEYGERLGENDALEIIYSRIGDFLKQRCKEYKGYVFTGNLELAKKVGLKANRRIEFYNSKIDCRLLEYDLYSGSKTHVPQ